MIESKLYVVSWNTTRRCNLRCAHCYLDADTLTKSKDEMSTEDGFRLIDEIAKNNSNAILILTGGEPLLRNDIYDLVSYAKGKGILPVLGTNGTLLTEEVGEELAQKGVYGVGVSIDSLKSELHDTFRGMPAALEKTIRGLEVAKSKGIGFQVQTTVTRFNIDEIEDIVRFSAGIGCRIYNLFFLVCTGRGQTMSDISPSEYEEVLSRLVILQNQYQGRMIIKAKCAPHFKRVAYQYDPNSLPLKGYITDCLAGKHYCRIDSRGNVTPCPYMSKKAGNVKENRFTEIWNKSTLFQELRAPNLSGRCGRCNFGIICGGCRARAFATTGSYLDDDPWCVYDPPDGDAEPITHETEEKYWVEEEYKLIWTREAKERLKKVPFFAKQMAVKAIERYARENNIKEITPEIMAKSRGKAVSDHINFMNTDGTKDLGPMAMFKALINKSKKEFCKN